MLAAGATAAVVSCVPVPVATPAAPATPATPAAPTVVPTWIHPKSLVRYMPGPLGNLAWKPGDSVKWLTPEKIAPGPDADLLASLPKAKLADMYRKMRTIRRFERVYIDLFLGGKEGLYQWFHYYTGEEAMAVGAIANLREGDFITSTHRCDGHTVATGVDMKLMAAECHLKATGYNKGRCGPSYVHDMHGRAGHPGMLSSGIVGGGYHVGAGAAWNFKVRGSKQVAMSIAGDGATPSRNFFGALRGATMNKLPYVVLIETNFQMVSVATPVVIPTAWCADMAVGLGIPCVVVDGNDIAAVYRATKEAVDRARAGEGPSLVEGLTYRWMDHNAQAGAKIGQDGSWGLPYRTDDEVRAWISRCPIKRFHSFLVERGLFTDAELKSIEAEVVRTVDEAVEFARSSPYANPEDMLKDTWSLAPVKARQF